MLTGNKKRKMFRRAVLANGPSVLLFFIVIPCLFFAAMLLPRAAFISTISFLSLHSRSPQWQWGAAACAAIVADCWGSAKVFGSGAEKVQTVFLVTPSAWHPLLSCWISEFIAWSFVRQHVAASLDRQLCVITELPSICNAPVLRLLFQLAGFYDYRTHSVKALLDRGFSLLFFDQRLAEMQLRKAAAPWAFMQLTVQL